MKIEIQRGTAMFKDVKEGELCYIYSSSRLVLKTQREPLFTVTFNAVCLDSGRLLNVPAEAAVRIVDKIDVTFKEAK